MMKSQLAAMTAAVLFGAFACGGSGSEPEVPDEETPMEEAAEGAEEMGEDAAEATEEAAEDTGDAVEEAAEDTEDAAEDATE